MMKFILVVILISSTQVFAKASCIVSLSSNKNNKITNLSIEAQDMLIMSSLIASQLWLEPDRQINFTVMLLSSFTEVEIKSEDKGFFHGFSLIDKTIFTVFKQLGILKTIQTFLLNKLNLSEHHLGPFKMKENGGLTLYLNNPPSISMVTDLKYTNTIDIFLNKANELKKSRRNPFQEESFQGSLTFNEFVLLVGPMHLFLSTALDTKDVSEMKSILHQVFLSSLFSRKTYSLEEKDEIIKKAIQLFKEQKNITLPMVARRLNVSLANLTRWIKQHERKYGAIEGRKKRRSSSQEERDKIVQEVIALTEQGISVTEAGRRLEIKKNTLIAWLDHYEQEQEHGPIEGRRRRRQK